MIMWVCKFYNSKCDCLSKNVPSLHNYKYLEIPIWNIQLNISWEGKEVLTRVSPLIYSYTISFSWQTLQRIASWIAHHFREFLHHYHKWSYRGGGWGWWGATEVAGFSTYWSWPARRSHLRLIWTLDITNSSQFDGQAFGPVVWRFPAGWILVHSHHCHLKTTWSLEHVRQARENSPKKSKPVNHWQWYTHGSLVHWCSNWLVVKSVPCHLDWTRPVFANLVTNITSIPDFYGLQNLCFADETHYMVFALAADDCLIFFASQSTHCFILNRLVLKWKQFK